MPVQPDTGTVQLAYATASGQLADQVAQSGKVTMQQVQAALDSVGCVPMRALGRLSEIADSRRL